ncbi:MAG: NifB/NifX family molybdenum-iron cluster-binding protein [Desulforhopalus sp.]|nr:NifB/NifX family molybdenum-iron cluster-binding protein [Desulforhopalus sp.]
MKEKTKILITAQGDFVAQRFDLAAEVVIATVENGEPAGKSRTIIMDRPSPEDLCNMIMEEDIAMVICGGIEDRHYQFLTWKKIEVIDSVIGDYQSVLKKAIAGDLQSGDLLLLARGDLSL